MESFGIVFTPPNQKQLNEITKDNLQALLEDYYRTTKAAYHSFEKLKICIRLSYANGKDYFNGEFNMKQELKTMLGRVEQVVLEETDEILNKR